MFRPRANSVPYRRVNRYVPDDNMRRHDYDPNTADPALDFFGSITRSRSLLIAQLGAPPAAPPPRGILRRAASTGNVNRRVQFVPARRPQNDIPNVNDAPNWTTEQVIRYMEHRGIDLATRDLIAGNDIDGAALLRVTKEDFRHYGMLLGPLVRLWAVIEEIKAAESDDDDD